MPIAALTLGDSGIHIPKSYRASIAGLIEGHQQSFAMGLIEQVAEVAGCDLYFIKANFLAACWRQFSKGWSYKHEREWRNHG